MNPRHALLGAALALAACSSDPEPSRPEAPSPVPPPPPPVTASAEPAATAAASASAPSPPDPFPRVAKALFPEGVDAEAARFGWLPSKKSFLLVEGTREEGAGRSVVLVLADETTRKELPVCDVAACGEDARSRVEKILRDNQLGDVVVIDPIRFPADPAAKPEVDVGALAAKVAWKTDRLEVARKGKPAQKLAPIPPEASHKPKPIAVAASPDGAFLAFRYLMDPGAKASAGFNAPTLHKVYRAPAP